MTSNNINNEETTETANLKLRASCNACHESKVRCTQTKPTCVRCERNGVVCIYGLSRRSHKDAPRILTPSRRSLSTGSRCPSTHQQQQKRAKECPMASNLLEMPPIMNFFGDQTLFNCTSEPLVHSEILGAHHDRGNDSFLGLALTTNRSEHGTQGAEWAADGVGSQFFTGRITDNHWAGLDLDASLIQASPDIQEQVPQQQQQDQDQQMAEPLIGYDEPECSCSCSPEAVPGLARTSPLFNRGKNQRLSFDIELSQIKRAIIGCEASVNCQSHAADPSMAMLMGVMIGGIIDGFEKLLVKDNPPAANGHNPQSPSCTPVAAQSADGRIQVAAGIGGKPKNGDQDSTMAEPRLTWGVLQLEDDDEADLRLRLCVLYFRRLEVLLKHFSQSVRFFRDGQDDQAAGVRSSAAQVMACDYMRIWLEEKAENVRLCLSKRHAVL